jgi:hypothetical protein
VSTVCAHLAILTGLQTAAFVGAGALDENPATLPVAAYPLRLRPYRRDAARRHGRQVLVGRPYRGERKGVLWRAAVAASKAASGGQRRGLCTKVGFGFASLGARGGGRLRGLWFGFRARTTRISTRGGRSPGGARRAARRRSRTRSPWRRRPGRIGVDLSLLPLYAHPMGSPAQGRLRQTGLPGSHDPLQMARLQLERSDRGTPTPAHEWGSFLFNTRRIRDSPSARGPTSCRRSRRRGATQETLGECYTPGQTNVTRQSECTRRPELVAQRQVGSCPPAWLSGNRAASARITVSS